MSADQKVMFEIYREAGYNRRYRVVYFTELNERNKETEINRALAGDHYADGFLVEWKKEAGKAAIDGWLDRLNRGEPLPPEELAAALREFSA
jgi:predicted transcriptional regulator